LSPDESLSGQQSRVVGDHMSSITRHDLSSRLYADSSRIASFIALLLVYPVDDVQEKLGRSLETKETLVRICFDF
jgi:hypothetical protein